MRKQKRKKTEVKNTLNIYKIIMKSISKIRKKSKNGVFNDIRKKLLTTNVIYLH